MIFCFQHIQVNEAAMAASIERQNLLSAANNQDTTLRTIKLSHFELALGKITPSVSEKVISHISD